MKCWECIYWYENKCDMSEKPDYCKSYTPKHSFLLTIGIVLGFFLLSLFGFVTLVF